MGGKAIAHHTSLLQSEMMPVVEDDSKPKDGNAEEGKKLDALKKGTSKKMSNKRIVNTGRKVNGEPLSGELAELNEKFRGDRFKEEDSFHASIPEPKRSELVKANSKMTCPLNDNLDGHLKNNDEFISLLSQEEQRQVAELTDLRKDVTAVKEDTIMQKVIDSNVYNSYITGDKTQVSGCSSKASDTAPFVGNATDAYENLRLDYCGTEFDKKSSEEEDIYVMRFTSDYCLDNSEYPYVNEEQPWNNPPCTGTGVLGGENYLIPEYTYGRGQGISDGVIYKVDKDGNESMAAAWNGRKGKFVEI